MSAADAPAASYDVIVVGGGPAGSTVGTLLAQYGHRVLIVERERYPRFHIGESLMPETYWTLRRIGMLEKMKRSPFVRKYSVQFANAEGRESAPFYFDEMNPHECSQTWQVLRSQFDEMMLANAAECGAEVWQETAVQEVIFEPLRPDAPLDAGHARAVGVLAVQRDGRRCALRAKVVVDATGTSALIASRLGIRRADPALRKAAVFAHFRGAARDPNPRDEGATLVLHVKDQNGWFWYIPLHEDVVSVGVVGDVDYLIRGRGRPEQILAEEVARCPAVQPRLARAERISPVHVLSDFSYSATRCAGHGWVLVGDALTFLDPIYSSGVFLALKSGELAADAVHAALEAGDVSAARLGGWGGAFYAGVQNIRKLVYAFYTKGFSFGQFNRAHPEHRRDLVNLLIGDVFRPECGRIFDTMGRYCTLPQALRLEESGGPA